jgi:hypothetical protein
MKKLVLLLIILVSLEAGAQNTYNTRKVYKIRQYWFLSAGAGTTVFLGDVAPVPKLTLKKNTNKYKFGYMFRIGKKIINGLDINLELFKGSLAGKKEVDKLGNPMDMAFKGNFWGLTLNARMDLLKFFESTKDFPFSFYIRVGVGPLYYRALMTHLSTGEFWTSTGYANRGILEDKRLQTTVLPYGFGLCYDISDNLRIEAGVDLYNAFTDNLDAHPGITHYHDKFIFISGSVVYGFDWDKWRAPGFPHQGGASF